MRARAIVKLTVEIQLDAVWGKDCTVQQVFKQGVHEAKEKLQVAIQKSTLVARARIVGDYTVAQIIAEPEDEL